MLSIKSLLNPEPERRYRVSHPPVDKRKMPKDAPVFRPGKIQGECRYPPIEERDEALLKAHQEFNLRPLGKIADYPRHIPYASDKKSFQEKTGRDSFHVFQYTFQIPGEEKEWHVMWDYNIGIVRITHLFKCNGYSKTTPGKMLSQNLGLRDICHSITGGALSAQGYWMPYDAAKALAATFCWRIRYALTPLFGLDFPDMCIHPDERKRHGVMVIDPEITRRATQTANYYRALEMAASPRNVTTHQLLHSMESFANDSDVSPKLPPIKHQRRNYTDSIASARDSSTEPYCMTPKSQSPCSGFTSINQPRSTDTQACSRVASPKSILSAISQSMRPENVPGGLSEDSDTESDGSSNMYSTPNCPSEDMSTEFDKTDTDTRSDLDAGRVADFTDSGEENATDDASDEDYRGPSARKCFAGPLKRKTISPTSTSQTKKNPSRRSRASRPRSSPHFANEVKAAKALIRLHMNELENIEVETQMDEDIAMHSAFGSCGLCSLDGSSRGGKRRRASL